MERPEKSGYSRTQFLPRYGSDTTVQLGNPYEIGKVRPWLTYAHRRDRQTATGDPLKLIERMVGKLHFEAIEQDRPAVTTIKRN